MMVLALLLPVSAEGAARGDSEFLLDVPQGTMRVLLHTSDGFSPDSPVLVVMHGVKRDADRYRDNWREIAAEHAALLIVPEFTTAMWPKSWGYNLGNIRSPAGAAIPRENWSFTALERAFDAAVAATGSRRTGYSLYGHSAGAQFVHRFITFTGAPRVERAVAANAGWYTLPQSNTAFPYGLGGVQITAETLRQAYKTPLTILLGEEDTDTSSRWLRRTPEALMQGPHRFARGHYYFEAAQRAAAESSAALQWRLATVPGVGHSNAGMAPAAARIIFSR